MSAKKIIVLVLILAGGSFLGYSLFVTLKSGANESGVVSCPSEGQCIWTAHVHAYLPISICGNDYRLPIEVGPLEGPHTHEEKNIAHWHDKLPYNTETKQITETGPLTLGAFFDAIETPFDRNRIADKINGAVCPDGKPGTLKVLANGIPLEDPRAYVWRNKDVISILFDSRTLEEVRLEVLETPVAFPALGRG